MTYPITYARPELQELCEKQATARRAFGDAGAKKLRRRVKELQVSPNTVELRKGPGGWHPITHDWPGCLGGELDGAATIIVRPVELGGQPGWLVECLGKCYEH